MRIIKEGNPIKKKKEKMAKCPNCECEFAFTEDEVEYSSSYVGMPRAWVYCPYCGHSIDYDYKIGEVEV